jgi:hypothetical protein
MELIKISAVSRPLIEFAFHFCRNICVTAELHRRLPKNVCLVAVYAAHYLSPPLAAGDKGEGIFRLKKVSFII